jgi:hypothetical protein
MAATGGPVEKKGVVEFTKPPKNPTPPWKRQSAKQSK